ncbi:flagellar hook-basal body complex protein FliE [Thalassotalea euphylliae]|uniref:Flagellar hook-basal body complex protein FliE n=1 Tax=Thalassotalea euphylliae TaxID=1655234 RepID=A0A3E0U105_9GAMM|nr:flagellar hook-basal body complex protein FliE [Thalassotalea euphylliae]REL30263.1 flagellar hook-basal body complex protein FliE [Thalassotalea euphylliae]REL34854.1 flagellar hook-basal body complex protein FliE [Thalassotalea euphylliae]
MDIKANSLLAQMQAMSVQATGNRAMPMESMQQVNASSSDFGNVFKQAIDTVNGLQQDAGQKRTAFEMGDDRVTLAETMIAAQKSSVAFEATVQVRNKFVEAYKEIMSMPV